MSDKIFIIGGAGYVGSALTEKLVQQGYNVTVYDLLIYGSDFLQKHKNLKIIQGDIRNYKKLENEITGHNICIHLACISNDLGLGNTWLTYLSLIFHTTLIKDQSNQLFHPHLIIGHSE